VPRRELAEKIEKWRGFWVEVAVFYAVVAYFFLPFLFIFSYSVVCLAGAQAAVQFLKLLARSGLWLALLVTVALLSLNTLLAVAKALLTGLTREEKTFIVHSTLLLLGYSMFLAAIFAPG
jgi:uncharacterized protein YqhQ